QYGGVTTCTTSKWIHDNTRDMAMKQRQMIHRQQTRAVNEKSRTPEHQGIINHRCEMARSQNRFRRHVSDLTP
ncbi:hypothetical protein, partial [Salmonella enterica]|uniref:hypothetical protein n=1 Tax=Salmonella enterica TaxID=28901 RepID=UPI0020C331D8